MRLLFLLLFLVGCCLSENPKNIIVTGRPTSVELIKQAVNNYLSQHELNIFQEQLNAEKDGLYEYVIPTLNLGEWKTIQVPFYSKPLPGYITLNIFNQPVEQKDPDYLIVSNEPEKVTKHGMLSAFVLNDKQSARFLFYHKNQTGRKILIALIADNLLLVKNKVHVLPAVSGSSKDGIYAGHNATKKYFRFWKNQEGQVISIEPGQSMVLLWQWLKPEEIISGLYQIQLITNGKIRFKLSAQDYETHGLAHLLDINKEENKNRISGLFPRPTKEIKKEVNLSWPVNLDLRYGDEPFIVDYQTGRKLRGNYGLLYRYKLELTNNTDNDKIIEFYFKPNGGVARGTFLINGVLRETELAGVSTNREEKLFYVYKVSSGKQETLELLTMPEAGSNYPATIIVRTRKE